MDFWQAVYSILGLRLNIHAQPDLNHNYVFISLIAFRKSWKKVELEELNALLFSLLKARMHVPPGCWIAPVGPNWMGTFILGSTCTSFSLSCTLPDSCPKPGPVGWWCWSFIERLPQRAAHWKSPSSEIWKTFSDFTYVYAESSSKDFLFLLQLLQSYFFEKEQQRGLQSLWPAVSSKTIDWQYGYI